MWRKSKNRAAEEWKSSFFDRLKALEKIEQLSLSESDKYSVSLYKAIENSAKASAGGNDDDC